LPETKKLEDLALPEEARERVREAANKMLESSLELTEYRALEAVAALLLAAGTAWAMAGFEYKAMIDLISSYYEHTLLRQAEIEVKEKHAAAFLVKKPEGSQ